MESGWFMLIVLAVMGGLIAYLGDKIGSKVGKRKIKLMGLRPKYTSILVTIMTGYQHCRCYLGCHVRFIGKCQSSPFRYE